MPLNNSIFKTVALYGEKAVGLRPDFDNANKQEQRVLKALQLIDTPLSFNVEELTVDRLMTIAKITNSATFHFSGNCVALANAFLYNIKVGKAELTVKNTYPIYEA